MVWDELLPKTFDDEFAFTDFKIAQSLHLRDRVHVYCITRWCMKKRADSMYLVLKPLQWHCTSMAAATRASWLCPPLCTNACMWCKCTWYASYTTSMDLSDSLSSFREIQQSGRYHQHHLDTHVSLLRQQQQTT